MKRPTLYFLDPKTLRASASTDRKGRQTDREYRTQMCQGMSCRFRVCFGGDWTLLGFGDHALAALNPPRHCSLDESQSQERMSCLVRCDDRTHPDVYFKKVFRDIRRTLLQLLRSALTHTFGPGTTSGTLDFIQGLSTDELNERPDVDPRSLPDRTILTASNKGPELTELQIRRNTHTVSLLNIENARLKTTAHKLETMVPERLNGMCVLSDDDFSYITKMSIEFCLHKRRHNVTPLP